MSRYQIKYNNEEEFLAINKLVSDKTFGDDYFRRWGGREDIPPNWYNSFSYYLVNKETFGFIGMNYGASVNDTILTIEELENLMMSNTKTQKIYQGDAYHFFVKSELYANLALSLFKKYGFTSINANKNYPVNWVIRSKLKSVGWNEAHSTSNPVVPMDEWEDCLSYIVNNSPIEINGYEVEFLENKAIQIGCTVVDFETLKRVWENLKD